MTVFDGWELKQKKKRVKRTLKVIEKTESEKRANAQKTNQEKSQ